MIIIFGVTSMIMKKNDAQAARLMRSLCKSFPIFVCVCANFLSKLLKYDQFPLPRKMITISKRSIKIYKGAHLSNKVEAWEIFWMD